MGTGSKTDHQTYAVAPTLTDATAPAGSAATAPPAVDPAPSPLQHLLGGTPSGAGVDTAAAPPTADLLEPAGDPPPAPAEEPQVPAAATGGPDPDQPEPPAPGDTSTGPGDVDEPAGGPPDALVDLPQELPVGLGVGVPALVGGADLVDSAATLIAYDGPGGPREVLLATVDEAAEAKLLTALSGAQQMIETQVEQEINGRLPIDEQQQMHEQVAKAARSVNARLKSGEEIPSHVLDYVSSAEQVVAAVETNPAATPAELAMAAHYRSHLDAIRARVDGTVTAAYTDGGKIPQVDPYLHTGTATVTALVPAPAAAGGSQLAATSRDATRINPTLDPQTGHSHWDGQARTPANGTEYAIDLGDGFSAVYRPYTQNSDATAEYSLRGKLEVIAPAGAGHAGELVERLGQLNLVNRAMNASEGEWSYLRANITAQGLGTHPAVTGALAESAHLEGLVVQELFHSHAHEAIGKNETELATMARGLQLEAAARVLPQRVAVVRDAVAVATGHPSGAALAASPGYDPTPVRSGGWLTWSRFDVHADDAALQQAWKGKRLVHNLSASGNISAMLSTGVLASTERRAAIGTAAGIGSSEIADKLSGGANSVFLRVRKSSSGNTTARLVWDDPHVLMRRADCYGYDGDHFGAVNPDNHNYAASALTRNPHKIAAFGQSNNEVMFRDGIDLLGAEAPSRIICGSDPERAKVLHLLAARGITHLRGRPVEQVVQ